ncbi:hypothetical protein HYPSUDRAFT_470365 [Hypholoma sublateritium FD-334 SS-4]|uniref:Uncharacterized protein n=1 Tax=Hypholoma sublateritium (strain FD-334 SS-4) TaxID=945553 RepID=A0A0D2NBG9_HYPSF|nr:hypothetical protein HYPSUDRAFT_470365 [Hypholoma sublateritium FD-334 SS-4]
MDHLRVPRYRAEHGRDIAEANTAYPMHLISEEDLHARDQQLENRDIYVNDAYPAHLAHDNSHPRDVRAPTSSEHDSTRSYPYPISEEQRSLYPVSTPNHNPGSSRGDRRPKKKKSSSRSSRSKRPEGYMYDYGNTSASGGQPAAPAAAYMYSYTPAPLPPLPRVVDGSSWEAYLFSTSLNSAYASNTSAVAAAAQHDYDSLAATYAKWEAVATHGYYAPQPAAVR